MGLLIWWGIGLSEASYLEINNYKVVKIVKTDNSFSVSRTFWEWEKKDRVSVLTILTTLSLLISKYEASDM